MALLLSDESSDEDIFMGDMTLKEVKKRLGVKVLRQSTVGHSQAFKAEDIDDSVKIIETHSTPNILSSHHDQTDFGRPISTPSLDIISGDWDIRPDDSFLRVEKMVSDMCLTTDKNREKDTGNDTGISQPKSSEEITGNLNDHQHFKTPVKRILPNSTTKNQPLAKSIQKPSNMLKSPRTPASTYTTPAKTVDINEYSTPLSNLKTPKPVFKTPGNPVSHKKPDSHYKRLFNNVVSPVSMYINSSPSAPLVTNVIPKKQLLKGSGIPMPVRAIPKPSVVNKENVKLPTVAYKSAKETKLTKIADKSKLPQSKWATQLVSSATVIRHNHREVNKKPLSVAQHQDSSCADLSLHQADVSVCTQHSAKKLPKPLPKPKFLH